MARKCRLTCSTLIPALLTTALLPASAAPPPPAPVPPTSTLEKTFNPSGLLQQAPLGWHTDFLGFGRGYFDLSFGMKVWSDKFQFRNLILSGLVDILPGVRARVEFRRREGKHTPFQVVPDEDYLEMYDQYRGRTVDGGISLRIGHVRSLHFPFPDAISLFDTVPDNTDFYAPVETDYRSAVLVAEVSTHSGWGAHWSGRAAGFLGGDQSFADTMEAYAFYRSSFGRGWRFETRAGDLAVRKFPVGQPGSPGYDAYLGKQLGEFNVGFLYEHKQNEPNYLGVAVQFRSNPVTRLLGRYMIDYSRRPEGLTAQVPIYHFHLNEFTHPRKGDVLVGEVRALRVRTLDVQGYVRNEYEYRLESWGDTSGAKLRCVVKEEPWYLQTEALVSPHTSIDARWFHDRSGPGMYVQRVTYRYYRPKQTDSDTAIHSARTNTKSRPAD